MLAEHTKEQEPKTIQEEKNYGLMLWLRCGCGCGFHKKIKPNQLRVKLSYIFSKSVVWSKNRVSKFASCCSFFSLDLFLVLTINTKQYLQSSLLPLLHGLPSVPVELQHVLPHLNRGTDGGSTLHHSYMFSNTHLTNFSFPLSIQLWAPGSYLLF